MLSWLTTELLGALGGMAALIAALFGFRWKSKRDGKKEMSHKIQARTLERLEHAKKIEESVDSLGPADFDDELRNEGWLRD